MNLFIASSMLPKVSVFEVRREYKNGIIFASHILHVYYTDSQLLQEKLHVSSLFYGTHPGSGRCSLIAHKSSLWRSWNFHLNCTLPMSSTSPWELDKSFQKRVLFCSKQHYKKFTSRAKSEMQALINFIRKHLNDSVDKNMSLRILNFSRHLHKGNVIKRPINYCLLAKVHSRCGLHLEDKWLWDLGILGPENTMWLDLCH